MTEIVQAAAPEAVIEATPEAAVESDTLSETESAAVQSFYDSLPEHLKSHKGLGKFDSVEKLAEGYVNASKLIGKRVSELTPEDVKGLLDTEAMAEVFRYNGVPMTPEEYQMADGLPPEIMTSLKSLMHTHNVSQEGLDNLIKFEAELIKKAEAQRDEEWIAASQARFGRDTESVLKTAKRAIEEFGGEPLKDFLNMTRLGNHPDVISTFYKVGKTMSEDTPVDVPQVSKPEGPREGLAELMKDPSFVQKWRSGHPDAMEKLKTLYNNS